LIARLLAQASGYCAPRIDPSAFIGRVVSHYRIFEKLGGGTGVVFKVEDTRGSIDLSAEFLVGSARSSGPSGTGFGNHLICG